MSINKFNNTGNFTIHCRHRISSSNDVIIHGILAADFKCLFTHPLITPNLPIDHPLASPYTSSAFALQHDTEFISDFDKTVNKITRQWQSDALRDTLRQRDFLQRKYKVLDMSFLDSLPFMDWIKNITPINSIKASTERMLWHQRLGHPSDHYLYTAHKFIDGVPQFKHFDPILERCPTCIRSEQPKNPGISTTKKATQPWMGFSIDIAFAGQSRKDSKDYTEFLGIHGEKCWIIIKDHFTDFVFGECLRNKAPPLNFLRDFLNAFCPGSDAKLGRYVHLDQGGELASSPRVCRLFKKRGFDIRPTGTDSSNQNGPVERCHQTTAKGIRSYLTGASLDVKFWPYSF